MSDTRVFKAGVLFFSGGWTVGGVERVTVVLANEMVSRGYDVTVCFRVLQERSLLKELDARVRVLPLGDGRMGAARRLRSHVRAHGVHSIFNASSQGLFLKVACAGMGCRIVRYNHTRPGANSHVLAGGALSRLLWRFATRVFMRLDYAFSTRYILLSKTYVPDLERWVGRKALNKVRVVENPLTCRIQPVVAKEKIVLYVGRLQESVKRVSRVIELWRMICGRHTEWRMEIVGDGPDRERLEKMADGLPRISFNGFIPSIEYYPKSSMLLLVSEFEGFPLVLREAQVHGCVPVVLGSFSSVVESIEDGVDGCVLPIPYDPVAFAGRVEYLMDNPAELEKLRQRAESKKEFYLPKTAADKLMKILEELK